MSRTALCFWTALILAGASIGFSVLRYQVMGQETKMPPGPGNYRVTLLARGQTQGDARLLTASPLDMNHQHIYGEEYGSEQLYPKPYETKHGDKRQIVWTQRPLTAKGPIEARYEFLCTIDVHQPSASMARVNKAVHAPPEPGEWIHADPGIDPSHADITTVALDLTLGLEKPIDEVHALFQFVDQNVRKEPAAGTSSTALECLQNNRGDALAKSRLLVALCRNRGIPSRLVSGIILNKKSEQKPHAWAEAWVEGAWMALCPYHHHCGKVPPNYLVFGFGDMALVRGINIADLDYAYLVEAKSPTPGAAASPSSVRQFFERISLYSLPPPEWHLVEFLLLLPVAALIICVYRNIIGLPSFGTFAPALIGLAFREVQARPGIVFFVVILLVGWCMRRLLDRYHLLQVPRTAFMLSLIVMLLIGLVLAANYHDIAATRYVSLFPMIILTGMIERFWTQETEEGAWSSFKILVCTLLSAASISLLLSYPPLVNHLVNYPETIGLVMACQLFLGRYTGYRLSEMVRFRDFVKEPEIKISMKKLGILGMNRRNAEFILDHNPRAQFPIVDDKLKMRDLCQRIGVPTPDVFAVISSFGKLKDLGTLLEARDEFVVKPNCGSGGRGILVVTGREGQHFLRHNGEKITLDDLRQHLSDILSGMYSLGGLTDVVLLQQRIRLHDAFAAISFKGIPDIRVILYKNHPALAMLRLPTRASGGRANLHQGGLGAGIDLATGTTQRAVLFGKSVAVHPDTGASLIGVKVPYWPRVLEMSEKVAAAVALGYVGVDIVIDARHGPMLLEANARPGLAIQMANGRGLWHKLVEIDYSGAGKSRRQNVHKAIP